MYIYILLRMTDTMTSQNINISSYDILCMVQHSDNVTVCNTCDTPQSIQKNCGAVSNNGNLAVTITD